MSDAAPLPACPFCGAGMTEVRGPGGRRSGIAHPANHPTEGTPCLLGGFFFGEALRPRWFRRVAPAEGIHMTIGDDNHPLFNQDGYGRQVGIDMVNLTVAYYKEQANGQGQT